MPELALVAAGAASGSLATHLLYRRRHSLSGRRASSHDPLTGVGDRQAGTERLARLNPGDAVVMVDIDHFKAVNDEHGHAHGDAVLVEFAATLAASVRADDLVARWGGDEFLVVLAAANDAAFAITQRLHGAWGGANRNAPVRCSAGVAVFRGGDPYAAVAAADAAMFSAKRAGRGSVVQA